MRDKPRQFAPEYGAQFQDQSVAAAYPNRPPYPAEVFTVLRGLITDAPRTVLDVGCGTGDIARRLGPLVERVDAVDVSAAMIARGRREAGGDASNLRWVRSSVEEAALAPPYALITAGESLHWFAWDVVFRRFAEVLSPHGALAIIDRDWDLSSEVRRRLSPDHRPVFDESGVSAIRSPGRADVARPLQAGGPTPDRPRVLAPDDRRVHRVPSLTERPLAAEDGKHSRRCIRCRDARGVAGSLPSRGARAAR